MHSKRKILLVEGRNIGDAVISTGVIESLGGSFPDDEIYVLTRPQFGAVFAGNPHIKNIFFAQFPMGTNKHFTPVDAYRLARLLCQLRHARFDMVINRMGDFREVLIGAFISRHGNTTISWGADHPFSHLVWQQFHGLANCVEIPNDVINIYAAQNYFMQHLGCTKILPPHIKTQVARENIIGIHPFSGQLCRTWPYENWIVIVKYLRQKTPVRLFCAPEEAEMARAIFKDILAYPDVSLCACPADVFFENLASCRLLIGLDSFSIHAAYALGVPGIRLNGANDSKIWLPPGFTNVSAASGCGSQPCFNKPQCRLMPNNYYACMNAITPKMVIDCIENLKTDENNK